jgi:subtilase family serine protease
MVRCDCIRVAEKRASRSGGSLPISVEPESASRQVHVRSGAPEKGRREAPCLIGGIWSESEEVVVHAGLRLPTLVGVLALAGAGLVGVAGAAAPSPTGADFAPALASRLALTTQPPSQAQCVATFTAPCYVPAQIQKAYDEQPLFARGVDGVGQTIVIVDAFQSPTIANDLRTFDTSFGLPGATLRQIAPDGATAFEPANADEVGWAGEITLDVEWAHAIAPGAAIDLVSARSDADPDIVSALQYVVGHDLGSVISQSYGEGEACVAPAVLDAEHQAFVQAELEHVTVVAGSGDTGAAQYGPGPSACADGSRFYRAVAAPASDPLVTAVGGTQLQLDAVGDRIAPDQVWNDTDDSALNELFFGDAGPNPFAAGGGKSVDYPRPSYQDALSAVVGDHRGVPDVSMSAACSGLVDTYESFAGQPAGWYVDCGTSEATPLFAGIVALADQVAHHPLGLINPALYALSAEQAPGIVDIGRGDNTVSYIENAKVRTIEGFGAAPGYDLASGVGTVDAALFVPELAQEAAGGAS